MKTTDPPIIIEQLFDNPINEVWKAITVLDQMTQWFFDNIPDFKAELGFKVQFNVKAPSRDFLHLWEVIEVIPNKRIVTNWKYKGFKGNSFVTFELFEFENQTKLILSTQIIEDFDNAIPEFTYKSGIDGWNYFIKECLTAFLKG
jgi:uncharacterized protein YndB with AHSA1/START domain